jgi:hypothetical protein
MPARRRSIRARGAAAAILAALAAGSASGCGASDEARGLSSAERATLEQKLTEVREAAADRDSNAAETALDEFVDEVGALQMGGTLDAETASGLLTGAARARRQLAVEVKPPPPPPPPPPPAVRTEPEKKPKPQEEEQQQGGGDNDEDGQGKGKKGRGNGNGDGEDD